MGESSLPPEWLTVLEALRQAQELADAYRHNPTPEAWARLREGLKTLRRHLVDIPETPPLPSVKPAYQVLVVEDEPDTAEMLAEMLALQGYHIKKFYRAQEAIEHLQRHRPDAVVLDIMMPETSGLEVLRFLRSQEGLREVPVVVVSAKGLPSDIRTALEAGAQAYLVKPVTFNDLVDTVERLLHG